MCVGNAQREAEQPEPGPRSPRPPHIPLAHLAEAALTHTTAVDVTVLSARQLPRGILAPRAFVRIFSPFHEEPLATTPHAPRSTAPDWHYTATVHLPHHPGLPPMLRVALYDADTPIGDATLTLTAHYTRAWLPLPDAGRADVHVEVRWAACPRREPPEPPPEAWCVPKSPSAAAAAVAASDELRSVDCRPGALFRSGLIAVELVATGIPASVAQPFVSLRTADQVLRAHEAEHSQQWWKRRRQAQADQLSEAHRPPSPSPSPPATTPVGSDSAASCTSPDSDCYSTDDGAAAGAGGGGNVEVNKAEGAMVSRSSLRRRLKKQGSNALQAVSKDGVRSSGKRALKHAKTKTLDAADVRLHAAATKLRDVKPPRSAVGATLTAAKIRHSPSGKRSMQAAPASTPATVLQTLLAPRLRRAVDFGCFWFAELAGVDPQRLTITVTDCDSHLPNVVGSIFDADIPLVLRQPGEAALFAACELGMARAKAAVWVRVTRIAAPHVPAAQARAVTPRFRELICDYPMESRRFKERYPHAEGLIYLFVGGLFTNYYPLYYSRNVDFLQQSLQLPRVQVVPIHTESGLAVNARVIAASVAKTATRRKSVVLIGHSKGGVDILEAISMHIEIIPFIYGVISFQAPFLGTYAIDVLRQLHLTDAVGNMLETMWNGQRESLLDMSYATRAAHLEMFARGPQAVDNSRALALREIPVVAFATSASFELHNAVRTLPGVAGFASMAAIATAITRFTGFLCDGLVAPVDAIVPFCDYVYLDDMSHLEPALYVPGTRYPPGELTAAALALLFEKAERENDTQVQVAQ